MDGGKAKAATATSSEIGRVACDLVIKHVGMPFFRVVVPSAPNPTLRTLPAADGVIVSRIDHNSKAGVFNELMVDW